MTRKYTIIYNKTMFKRLKNSFFCSQTQKKLSGAGINKLHEFVQPKDVNNLTNLTLNAKTKNELLNFIYKGINSTNNTLAIKCLIVVHCCLRRNFDEDICSMICSQNNISQQNKGVKRNEEKEQDIDDYINTNVRNFYLLYLKKICFLKQSYIFIKNYMNKQLTVQYTQFENQENNQPIEIVCHGFKILNIAHFIFQSQQMFNKMGRYHIQFQQIMSIYVQLLEDFNLFNSYINKTVGIIILNNNSKQIKQQKQNKKQISQTDIKLRKTTNYHSKIAKNKQQQYESQRLVQDIKHFYLYINQCQKVSDRLYQFYHNRYYYKLIKPYIRFPTFLVIKNQQYRELTNKVRRLDKNLVNSVKMSKYEGSTTNLKSLNRQQSETKNRRRATSYQHNKTVDNLADNNFQDKFYQTQIFNSKTEYTIEDQEFS